MADPTRRLLRALARAGDAAGVSIAWEVAEANPWASALFTGFRHRLSGSPIAGAVPDAFLSGLSEADLAVPGWFVADLVVDTAGDGISARVLMIEESGVARSSAGGRHARRRFRSASRAHR